MNTICTITVGVSHVSNVSFATKRFSSYLYKGIACSIVGYGEAQGVFRLVHFHLLFDSFNVGKDEILQTDLPPEQLLHVNLVGVEGTEQDL